MIYYANGCSFTWGGNLYEFIYEDIWLPRDKDHPLNKERLDTVYSYHLGKLLKADTVINDSLGCGSNYRIMRTTLDYFNSLIYKGISLKDHFVTIQWTEPSRFEYYDDISDTWNMLTNATYLCENRPEHPDNLKDVYNFYYKNLYSNKQSLDIFVSNVICLGSFFSRYQIPYLFYTHTNFWSDYITTSSEYDYYNKILLEYNWWGDLPTKSFMGGGKLDGPLGAHPTKRGHKQWAEFLFDDIKKKKLLNIQKCETL